jgi:hypothetical protein
MSIEGSTTGIVLAVLMLGSAQVLPGQSLAPRLTAWRPMLPIESPVRSIPIPEVVLNSETRSHALTGLLIGGAVGVVAAGVFLAIFCSDADTQCGADEVGRAVVIIAVPPAVVGAVIGSLIRTKR